MSAGNLRKEISDCYSYKDRPPEVELKTGVKHSQNYFQIKLCHYAYLLIQNAFSLYNIKKQNINWSLII